MKINIKNITFITLFVLACVICWYELFGGAARKERISLLAERHGASVSQDALPAGDVPYSGHADDQVGARFEFGPATFIQMSRGRRISRNSIRYVLDDGDDFVGVAAAFDLSRLSPSSRDGYGGDIIDLRLTGSESGRQALMLDPLPSLVSLRVTNGLLSVSDFPVRQTSLKHVHLKGCALDGSWLDQLLGTGLQELELNECDIVEDAAPVRTPSGLRVLTCSGPSVSGACLARASRLSSLRGLLLAASELSREDCRLIGQLRGLTHLMIGWADLDLAEMAEWDLPNLRMLVLTDTHITSAIIPDVQALFPNAHIVVGPQTKGPPTAK